MILSLWTYVSYRNTLDNAIYNPLDKFICNQVQIINQSLFILK